MDAANNGYEEKSNLLALNLDEHSSKPVELFSEKKELEKLKPVKFNEIDESKENLKIGNNDNNLASNIAVPTLFSSSLKTVSALLIVLSLMLMIVYFVKKYLLKEGSLLGMDKQIKVLSTSYIAPKKSINLVEVAGEILVLGMTANNITFLNKIENKETIEKIKRDREKTLIKPSFSSFAFNSIKSKKGIDKKIKSAFSKQLDICSERETRRTEKNANSIKALNSLIQEKIKKLKTA
jgi:flagellar protein FliO/FliZ